jgi:hypothetical protein
LAASAAAHPWSSLAAGDSIPTLLGDSTEDGTLSGCDPLTAVIECEEENPGADGNAAIYTWSNTYFGTADYSLLRGRG